MVESDKSETLREGEVIRQITLVSFLPFLVWVNEAPHDKGEENNY